MQNIEAYNELVGLDSVDDVIKKHSSMVIKIAKSIKRRLPSSIEFEDLVQSGFMGLIEANRTYKVEQGTSFEGFASLRVKGAILDYLRKNSVNNRDIIKRIKELGKATTKLEQKNQRAVMASEIASEMNISMGEFDEICQYINLSHTISMDVDSEYQAVVSDVGSPEDELIRSDLKENLKTLLLRLPEREQILLSLYYIEELTFKEIGEVLDLTEARVCQLHAAAIAKLSERLP